MTTAQDLSNEIKKDRSREFITMVKPCGPICNLDCTYCYYLEKKSLFKKGEHFRMQKDVLHSYVKNVIESSDFELVQFVWHGGEPTLMGIKFFKEVLEIQKRIAEEQDVEKKIVNIIQTNGVLLDDEWCKFLYENKFWVGLSLDGPKLLHDASRRYKNGYSTHRDVIKGFKNLLEVGINPDILCTLNSTNADHPAEIYNYFKSLGANWLQFLPIVARDSNGSLKKESVKPEQYGYFLNTVFDIWVRNDVETIIVQAFVESLLAHSNKPASLCINAETCGNALVVEHDGSVYSCDHFVNSEHLLGNISNDKLIDMIQSDFQEEFGNAKKDRLSDDCLSCEFLNLCRGGCPKDRKKLGSSYVIAHEVGRNGARDGVHELCIGLKQYFVHTGPIFKRMVELAKLNLPVSTVSKELKGSESALSKEVKAKRRQK